MDVGGAAEKRQFYEADVASRRRKKLEGVLRGSRD